MEIYLRFVDRWSKAILVVLAAVTVFFAYQMTNLTFDSNPYLLSESHPARKTILDMQKEFGGTFDAAQLAFHNPGGIFNRATLNAVLELTQKSRCLMVADAEDASYLRQLAQRYASNAEFKSLAAQILHNGLEQNDYFAAERLEALAKTLQLAPADQTFLSYLPRRLNPVKEIASLAATDNILTRDGVLNVTRSLRDTATPPEKIREEVVGNEMLRGLMSRDQTVTQLIVEFSLKQDDADGQVRAYEALGKLVSDYRKTHPEFKDEVHIAGASVAVAEAKRLTDRDLNTLFPLVVAVIGAILIGYFRKPLGFVLPMLNVVMCTVWTLGMMSLFQVPLDTITSVLPVFLITICGADAIHMMNEYYAQKGSGISAKEAVKRTVREMFSPVVLTTATTVAGFLFSTATNISSIRAFGLSMVVGLLAAQVIALLLIPAWLNLTKDKTVLAPAKEAANDGHLGQALESGLNLLIRNRKPASVLFLLLLASSAYLASRIVVEDAGSSYFKEDNAFRKADEFINAHVSGTSPGWLRIERTGKKILDVEAVTFIDQLDTFLLSQANVTFTYSLATYLKRMNLALNDMRPEFNRIPAHIESISDIDPATGKTVMHTVSGDQLISQLILMYENGGGDELNYVLKRDASAAATLFSMNTTLASEYKQFLSNLDGWLKTHTPAGFKVTVAGTPVIWSGVLDEIIKGQFVSIILALTSVAAVLMLWLRSFKEGLLASLPLAATTVLYYGLMALAGIELNVGTALISFIVVGIVDYSVHYLHRIKARLATGGTIDDALCFAIRNSGKSIAFNVAVFSCGFLVLLFSEYKPIFYLGGLVAMALLISGFMSLFMISLLAPVFLKSEHGKLVVVGHP